ncbi:MAG: PD-(D/E)XK nuclease family protein [Candidatus Micrarchaeia archaeon]
MRKWSPTMINATKKCKRHFEKKFIEEAPAEVIIQEFEQGKQYHEIAERFLITGNDVNLQGLNSEVQKALKEIKNMGKLYIEKEFENEIIRGIADIVIDNENEWIVIDIKSRYDSDISQDDYVQLYTYLYFLQQEQEKENARIGILALHNQFHPLHIEQAQYKTLQDLKEYVEHQIELAEKRIQHMRINTSYCKYCEYILSCDAITEKPVSIEEIARKYLQLEQLLKQYEYTLREHVNITGQNIVVDDVEIGMHIRNVTKIDEELLLKIAKEQQIPLHTIYKPDITNIKKLAKKHQELANAINIEQDYYFTSKKIKG